MADLKNSRNLLLGLALFFILLTVLFIVWFKASLIFIIVILLTCAVYCVCRVIKANKLLKQLASIRSNETYDVLLEYPTVKYKTYGTDYGAFTHRPQKIMIDRIYLTDTDGKTYCYFLNHDIVYNDITAEQLKEKLARSLTVSCYKNSTIIRSIENDPYFFRICN